MRDTHRRGTLVLSPEPREGPRMKRCLVLVSALCLLPAARALAQPSRADYIAEADPICQQTIDAQRRAAGPKGFVGPLNHGHYKAGGRSMRRVFAAFGPGVEQV